ncbi:MAG: hypothetical protein EBZ61_11110 [Micrococcales bacterium]|nr:hypothetical protein [Micrococcales bacterium]
MATVSKVLARTAAATTSTTLYTTPSGSTAVVTNIAIANTTASAVTATVSLNSVALLSSVSVAANTTAFIDLKQVLSATQTITGQASTTAVNFHISGVEIA